MLNKDIMPGMGEATEKALDFLEKIIAGPFIEATGILTDKVKYWRFKNQVDIVIKARQFVKEKGIKTPKQISIKDVSTLLELASFEDEDLMQESWSKLLANTLDPKNKFNVCHIFSQILNQLSVNEIYILNAIGQNHKYIPAHLLMYSSKNTDSFPLLLDNLIRLRLIEREPPRIEKIDGGDPENKVDNNNESAMLPISELQKQYRVHLTEFGIEFCKQISI